MAHILFLSFGSRGDVQPCIALALELQTRGHTATIAAPAAFEGFVTGYGVGFHPLPGDPHHISRLLNAAGGNPFRQMRDMFAYAMPLADAMIPAVYAAAENADAVVHTFAFVHTGYQLRREKGIPDVSLQLFPMFVQSGAFPNPAFGGGLRLPVLNRLSHAFGNTALRLGGQIAYALLRWRPHSDLPPWPGGWAFTAEPPTPLLLAMSPTVLPPFDDNAYTHVTGYLTLPPTTGYTPPLTLAAFLEAGPPPVYIGFGSMIDRHMPRIVGAVREALAMTGVRAVLSRGWGIEPGLVADDPHIHLIGSVPHDWLFPQMAGLVIHGGAGTTAAALRSGVPTLIVPFTGDQPFWGARVHALGCGPPPLPKRQLTAPKLAERLHTLLTDEAVQARAAAFGVWLRTENGPANAAAHIERALGLKPRQNGLQ